ncbi:Uncharacterized protein Fot_56160 [Forsythia ovata]|uniref:Uncharacterized protein n=1 Tax=Forsythia ovata TaxID=205694 RepID=A0ABD1P1A6_9LAMI
MLVHIQAYTNELELEVANLLEENARLEKQQQQQPIKMFICLPPEIGHEARQTQKQERKAKGHLGKENQNSRCANANDQTAITWTKERLPTKLRPHPGKLKLL